MRKLKEQWKEWLEERIELYLGTHILMTTNSDLLRMVIITVFFISVVKIILLSIQL